MFFYFQGGGTGQEQSVHTWDFDVFGDDEEVVAAVAGEGISDFIVQESNFPGFKGCVQDVGDIVFTLIVAGEDDSFSLGEPGEEVLDFLV